eukprot:Protomagalhaensia_wolfi_Nauph_80__18@NODE_1012_length_1811_cov_32_533296_g765_i0_p2_GENE_NODE_1012_length_1811_cov_32_533296_g765_i0NODE_1012_length_1811_cov_32_533296_g765_i0_p2_ORF_typecomplete_len102_score0_42_NODE_1012_length_1811_cov_32_533296_g765_i0434739
MLKFDAIISISVVAKVQYVHYVIPQSYPTPICRHLISCCSFKDLSGLLGRGGAEDAATFLVELLPRGGRVNLGGGFHGSGEDGDLSKGIGRGTGRRADQRS